MVDARDGTVMFAKRPDSERAIASTTKLMTALLALERTEPSDVFAAPLYNASPAESRINLRQGERMSVHDLLEALLLESANDAAVTLAEGVSGSREAFVDEMNERAAELGLEHTSYANPIGLDEAGNYASSTRATPTRSGLTRPATTPRHATWPDSRECCCAGRASPGSSTCRRRRSSPARGRAWWRTATTWSPAIPG